MPTTFNLRKQRGRYHLVRYDKNRVPARKQISLGTGDQVTAQQARRGSLNTASESPFPQKQSGQASL